MKGGEKKELHKIEGINKLIKYNLHFSKYIPKIYLTLVPVSFTQLIKHLKNKTGKRCPCSRKTKLNANKLMTIQDRFCIQIC